VYEELEARVEETVRDALYGEAHASFLDIWQQQQHHHHSQRTQHQCRTFWLSNACLRSYMSLHSLPCTAPLRLCCVCCNAEARSVVVTQPNNKLSRILKALLKEVPAQLAAINAASMAASLAMADVNLAAIGGPGAAEAAKERLQQRLQLIQALQVRLEVA
jgi:hypothetical protein